jgi:hypothetical protein
LSNAIRAPSAFAMSKTNELFSKASAWSGEVVTTRLGSGSEESGQSYTLNNSVRIDRADCAYTDRL